MGSRRFRTTWTAALAALTLLAAGCGGRGAARPDLSPPTDIPDGSAAPDAHAVDAAVTDAGASDTTDTDTTPDATCAATAWTVRAPMPTPRFGCAAATYTTPEGALRIAVVGGFAGGFLAAAQTYDPALDTWTTLAPLGHARSMPCAVAAAGRVHVLGGYDGSDVRVDHEVFDPATGAWTAASPLPTLRADFGAAVAGTGDDATLHVVGGYDESARDIALHEAFSPADGSWRTLAPLPTPRSGLALATATAGGRTLVFAIGGTGPDGVTASNEAYDPVADAWTARAPMPTARRWAAAAVAGNLVLVAGGAADKPGLDVVEAYDPETDTWTTAPPLPTGRSMAAGASVGGRVHVIGGSGGARDENEALVRTCGP